MQHGTRSAPRCFQNTAAWLFLGHLVCAAGVFSRTPSSQAKEQQVATKFLPSELLLPLLPRSALQGQSNQQSHPEDPSCEDTCAGQDESCKSQCEFVQSSLCGSACRPYCLEMGHTTDKCSDLCEELQSKLCREGITLPEVMTGVADQKHDDVPPEPVNSRPEDVPEPIDENSPLWPDAKKAAKKSMVVINSERKRLGFPEIPGDHTKLLHAWMQIESDTTYRLCVQMDINNQREFITVHSSGDHFIGVTPVRVVFGDGFAYKKQQELEKDAGPASIDENSWGAEAAVFPCDPYFSKLLQTSRKRMGLQRGLGMSGGLAGRKYRAASPATELPEAYSSRETFPKCALPVRDQGACGSCYSFAAAAVAGERLCIARTKAAKAAKSNSSFFQHRQGRLAQSEHDASFAVVLSTQELVSCGSVNRPALYKPYCTLGPMGVRSRTYSNGCNGGTPFDALYYAYEYGLPSKECTPYTSGGKGNYASRYDEHAELDLTAGKVPICTSLESKPCHAGRRHHSVHRPEVIQDGDVEGIMRAIYETGPVYATLNIHQDFMHGYPRGFADGVYTADTSKPYLGGHAAILDGWGTSAGGMPYWHGRNSWGERWGLNGYFKIRRGSNDAGVEDGVHYARAVVSREDKSEAPDAGTECLKVQQQGSTCRFTNVCDGQVRKVKVSYLGSEVNCGGWTKEFPKFLPTENHAITLQHAHVCTVISDEFVENHDSKLYYEDVSKKYPGYLCVLQNTYKGPGKRVRWCGEKFAELESGGLAAFPTDFCEDGCKEAEGVAVFETTE